MENGSRPTPPDISRRFLFRAAGAIAGHQIIRNTVAPIRIFEDVFIREVLHPTTTVSPLPTETPTRLPSTETAPRTLQLDIIRYPDARIENQPAVEDWKPRFITMHWTVGTPYPNSEYDLKLYNFTVDADGQVHEGMATIKNQAPLPGNSEVVINQQYAAHTEMRNTRNIGLSVCGSDKAIPNLGVQQFTKASLDKMLLLAAYQAKTYGIPIDAHHIKTHYQWSQIDGNTPGRQEYNTGKVDIIDIPWMPQLDTPEKVHSYLLQRITTFAQNDIKMKIV